MRSKRNEIVQKEEIKFVDEKIVIKSDVSNLCETSNLNSSSLNKSCVEIVEIEKEKKEKRKRFYFEFFAIDFVLNCFHVRKIENLQCVVSIIKKSQNLQKKRKEKKMFFEAFNQYRKSRSTSNENDASLTQKVFEEKEVSKSTFREKKATFVTKKIVQFRFSTTISSLQTLQMLFR